MRYLGNKIKKSISDDLKFSEYSIFVSQVEKDDFLEDTLKKSPRLMKVIEEEEEEYPEVYELALDIYNSLYKYNPLLLKEEIIKFKYILNYGAIKQLLQNPKYKEIRSITRVDEMSSLIGTEMFLKEVMVTIRDLQEKYKEKLKAYEEAKKKAKEEYDKKKEESGEKDNFTLEEAKKKLEESKKDLRKLYKNKQKRQLKKAINDLQTEVNGVQDTIGNWGLGNDQSYQQMPYEEKMQMLNDLNNNKKLKKIALLAGKFMEIFLEGKKAKTKKTRSHIEDVTMGDDVPRVLCSELMKLRHPTLRKQFIKTYSEKRLLQHEYGGKVRKGKGPIVSLVDCSGSMSGENEVFAKAICLALLNVARRQKRSFMVVHFDSGAAAENLKSNKFSRKNPYNIKEVIDMASYFGGGGTEFEPPLERGQQEINKEKEFSKADLIMITDGNSAISDRFLKDFLDWKHKKNVNIFSILVDKGWASTATLNEFSDKVETIDNIDSKGNHVARSLFSTLW